MSIRRDINGIYGIWLREFKVFTREHSRLASAVFTPLLWLFVFGSGLGSALNVGGYTYQTFIFPGILAMNVMFTSLFFGVYIIWDRKIDFLKEVLVAPISRVAIFFGKAVGGISDALIESLVLLSLSPVFEIKYSLSTLAALFVLFLFSLAVVSIGLTIGSLMESPEGFGMVISFVAFPMFFLSGALFPAENLPAWLSSLMLLNPMSYAVDALRGILLGYSKFPLILSIGVLLLVDVLFVFIGVKAFNRMRV